LPVPVCAVASTSRPSRAGGMQLSCTGVGVTNLLASSRAMRAGERENSENCVVKIRSFPVAPGADRNSARPAIGSGQKRHANSSKSAGLRIKFCVRENRRVELRLAHHSIGARSCHTLHHRQTAHCRTAPRSCLLPVHAPDLIQGYKGVRLSDVYFQSRVTG